MSWAGNNKDTINNSIRNFENYPDDDNAVAVVFAYYNGATTRYAKWLKSRWRLDHLIWFLRWRNQTLCYAKPLTENFLSRLHMEDYSLTAESVAIICSVFKRFGRGRYDKEARTLLLHISRNRPDHVALYTDAFLIMHKVYFCKMQLDHTLESQIVELALSTVKSQSWGKQSKVVRIEYAQASLIYSRLAKMLPDNNPRRTDYLKEAIQLARKAGAADQLLKLKV